MKKKEKNWVQYCMNNVRLEGVRLLAWKNVSEPHQPASTFIYGICMHRRDWAFFSRNCFSQDDEDEEALCSCMFLWGSWERPAMQSPHFVFEKERRKKRHAPRDKERKIAESVAAWHFLWPEDERALMRRQRSQRSVRWDTFLILARYFIHTVHCTALHGVVGVYWAPVVRGRYVKRRVAHGQAGFSSSS